MNNRAVLLVTAAGEIPWHSLTGPYERADAFPQWVEQLAAEEDAVVDAARRSVAMNFEHQGTLWTVTPFAMLLLRRTLAAAAEAGRSKTARRVLELFLEVFETAEAALTQGIPEPLPLFSDMLLPQNLPPDTTVDEEGRGDEDAIFEEYYEEMDESLFTSCFYYSWYVLGWSLREDFPQLADSPDAALQEALSAFAGEKRDFLLALPE